MGQSKSVTKKTRSNVAKVSLKLGALACYLLFA